MTGECPICGAEITLAEGTVVAELVSCSDCGSELEVKKLDPVTFEEAPQEEEDWGQ